MKQWVEDETQSIKDIQTETPGLSAAIYALSLVRGIENTGLTKEELESYLEGKAFLNDADAFKYSFPNYLVLIVMETPLSV